MKANLLSAPYDTPPWMPSVLMALTGPALAGALDASLRTAAAKVRAAGVASCCCRRGGQHGRVGRAEGGACLSLRMGVSCVARMGVSVWGAGEVSLFLGWRRGAKNNFGRAHAVLPAPVSCTATAASVGELACD